MRRRTWAGLLAVVLMVAMSVQAWREPVPYVTFAPGPTVNVLGKGSKDDIISVSGHRAYRDSGGLRLTTVIPSGSGTSCHDCTHVIEKVICSPAAMSKWSVW